MITQANKDNLHDRLENLRAYKLCFDNLRALRIASVHRMPSYDEYKNRILTAYPEAVFMINEIETRGNFE